MRAGLAKQYRNEAIFCINLGKLGEYRYRYTPPGKKYAYETFNISYNSIQETIESSPLSFMCYVPIMSSYKTLASDCGLWLKRKFSFSYFRENLFSLFAKKSLRKVTEITKIFAKTKMYEKTDAGNGKYCEIS
jgi:hypothetical protein